MFFVEENTSESNFNAQRELTRRRIRSQSQVRVDFRIGTTILRHSEKVTCRSVDTYIREEIRSFHPVLGQIVRKAQVLQAKERGILQNVGVELRFILVTRQVSDVARFFQMLSMSLSWLKPLRALPLEAAKK